MRVLICGARGTAAPVVRAALDSLMAEHAGNFRLFVIYADNSLPLGSAIKAWLKQKHVEGQAFTVEQGRRTDSERRQLREAMFDIGKPDLVVALPGGRSTAKVAGIATKRGVPLRKIAPEQGKL